MKSVDVMPLIVDLVDSFFVSSREALERARTAKERQGPSREQPELSIRLRRGADVQATLESVVFSFLTVEATMNYLFTQEQRSPNRSAIDGWLRQRWQHGLSVADRLTLLVARHASAPPEDYGELTKLFSEFVGFRNRIVHAQPEEYDALVEPGSAANEVLVHDVQLVRGGKAFPASGLSDELGKISVDDAGRCFEIMLLVLAFLDEQLVADLQLPWPLAGGASGTEPRRPTDILMTLPAARYYPRIDPLSFVPEFVARIRAEQAASPRADP